jgi:methionyl-tRNA formyltransferase
MKILLFSGDHSRHLFVNQTLLSFKANYAAVVMHREDPVPKPPALTLPDDVRLFNHHFSVRYELERAAFGDLVAKRVFADIPTHYCNPSGLCAPDTITFVKKFKPDIAFIFGTDLIRGDLLKALPKDKLNLHLGLSPWYRGSATLFWPFYFLQPQYAGVTFHNIIAEADAGEVLHQRAPALKRGDGIHDVAVKSIELASQDVIRLMQMYELHGKFSYHKQTMTGKLFLSKDFHPSHLRVIYDLYDNKQVDYFLSGEFGSRSPLLINAL